MNGEAVGVADEGGVADDRAVERDDGCETLDMELGQRAARASQCLLAVGPGDDQLGKHGVELAADHRAGFHTGVQSHAGTGRRCESVDRSGRGQEAAAGVFAVDPELEGVPARGGIFGDVQFLAVGDAELLENQINA